MNNIQFVTLAGPSQVPHNQLMGASTPYQLRCENGLDYTQTDAYAMYNHARTNALTVSRYLYDQKVSMSNGVATFEDGSQLLFAQAK